MQIFPSVDILDGQVVRLFQGNFEQVFHYNANPLKAIQAIAEQGFSVVHIIDLTATKTGVATLLPLVREIKSYGLNVQIGGGIRDLTTAREYLDQGLFRIILSTAAVQNPLFWRQLAQEFGVDRLALSLDIKGSHNAVAIEGWQSTVNKSIDEVLDDIGLQYIKNVIVTDISKDGTLLQSDPHVYESLVQKHPEVHFIAAGGVSSVITVQQLQAIGIRECIVGRAFYEDSSFAAQLASIVLKDSAAKSYR